MNDASRELGAALGVAGLGSVAASRFGPRLDRVVTVVPAAARSSAGSSLGGALEAAAHLSGAARTTLTVGAQRAFVDGLHLAATIAAIVTGAAVVLAYCFLPRGQPTAPEHELDEPEPTS